MTRKLGLSVKDVSLKVFLFKCADETRTAAQRSQAEEAVSHKTRAFPSKLQERKKFRTFPDLLAEWDIVKQVFDGEHGSMA